MDRIFKKITCVRHSKIKFSKTISQLPLLRRSRAITFSFHKPHSTTSIVKQKLERERLHVNRFPRSEAKSSRHGAHWITTMENKIKL